MTRHGMKHGFRWGVGLCGAVLVAACLPLVPAAGRAQSERPALRLLATYTVPGKDSAVTDVRWSGDGSVMVVRREGGVRELELGEGITLGRQPIPDPQKGGRGGLKSLGVSPQYVATANTAPELLWRPFATQKDRSFRLEIREIGAATEDIDVAGDRLLLLGHPFPKLEDNQGVIAWVATLGSDLRDWKPLLRDVNAGKSTDLVFYHCLTQAIGAARFLPDGTIAVVPGSQPGVHLFSREGRPLRTWTSRQVGLNTDCRTLPKALETQMRTDEDARVTWLNGQRVLDDILPLPQGPGLLIRSFGADGRVHWELKVLEQSRIATYEVPLTGQPFQRLHGDVRGSRIVLLLRSARTFTRNPVDHAGQLILAELPPQPQVGGHS